MVMDFLVGSKKSLEVGTDFLPSSKMDRLFTNISGGLSSFSVLSKNATCWVLMGENYFSMEDPPCSGSCGLDFVVQGQDLLNAITPEESAANGPFIPHWWALDTFWTGFALVPLNGHERQSHWYYHPMENKTAFHLKKRRFKVDDFRKVTYKADLVLVEFVVSKIKDGPTFLPGNTYPMPFEVNEFDSEFTTIQELNSVLLCAKIYMLSALGFICWAQATWPASWHGTIGCDLKHALEGMDLLMYGF